MLVESYLIVTLLIYYFGPVQFRGHNQDLFFLLMLLYHLAFIFGYYIAARTYKFNGFKVDKKFSVKFFYVSLFFAVLGVLISYKNLMLASSIIPYDIFNELLRGASEPGMAYAERMQNMPTDLGAHSGSRVWNILLMSVAFFKLFFIFLFSYFSYSFLFR